MPRSGEDFAGCGTWVIVLTDIELIIIRLGLMGEFEEFKVNILHRDDESL
jgi:hypothetical protein